MTDGVLADDEAAVQAVEEQVARTADLVLKVHALLDRSPVPDDPAHADRLARLRWAVARGQSELGRCLPGASPPPAPPQRRP